MKYVAVKLSLFIFFIFSTSASCTKNVNDLCRIEHIDRVEITNIPLYIATQSDITEEELEESYTYKIIVRGASITDSNEMIKLLQMKYSMQEKNISLRWHVYILSEQGNVCDLYFDGFGYYGKINGVNVRFEQNRMIDWIERKMPLLTQSIV